MNLDNDIYELLENPLEELPEGMTLNDEDWAALLAELVKIELNDISKQQISQNECE